MATKDGRVLHSKKDGKNSVVTDCSVSCVLRLSPGPEYW